MFMPQRPYLPLGTLRAAVSYPAEPGRFDDAAVARRARAGRSWPPRALARPRRSAGTGSCRWTSSSGWPSRACCCTRRAGCVSTTRSVRSARSTGGWCSRSSSASWPARRCSAWPRSCAEDGSWNRTLHIVRRPGRRACLRSAGHAPKRPPHRLRRRRTGRQAEEAAEPDETAPKRARRRRPARSGAAADVPLLLGLRPPGERSGPRAQQPAARLWPRDRHDRRLGLRRHGDPRRRRAGLDRPRGRAAIACCAWCGSCSGRTAITASCRIS